MIEYIWLRFFLFHSKFRSSLYLSSSLIKSYSYQHSSFQVLKIILTNELLQEATVYSVPISGLSQLLAAVVLYEKHNLRMVEHFQMLRYGYVAVHSLTKISLWSTSLNETLHRELPMITLSFRWKSLPINFSQNFSSAWSPTSSQLYRSTNRLPQVTQKSFDLSPYNHCH